MPISRKARPALLDGGSSDIVYHLEDGRVVSLEDVTQDGISETGHDPAAEASAAELKELEQMELLKFAAGVKTLESSPAALCDEARFGNSW